VGYHFRDPDCFQELKPALFRGATYFRRRWRLVFLNRVRGRATNQRRDTQGDDPKPSTQKIA